jgi:DNA-binding response OmpR family regulator
VGALLAKHKGARLISGIGSARRRLKIPASILIADDDPNILRALSFVMQREGHDVRTATDGQEALDAIAAARPDLLLLDVMMPRGNGHEVCRTLRASRNYDDIRIVMLTARGQEADQRAGLALGADAYVTKPFAISDVVECVADVLMRPRRAATNGTG